jgi:hypothetical protein
MPNAVKIFLSYSHKDAGYLEDDSLLGYLKGLAKEGAEFWIDRQIRVGEPWDEVIKAELAEARIALVLVSQAFLDSDYCQNVEIESLLAHKAHLFPVILSACDWRRHDWLAKRQFIPSGDQTVEEHHAEAGARKRLFHRIREGLLERIEQVRDVSEALSANGPAASPSRPESSYSGKQKVLFCQRLSGDWRDLADYLDLLPHETARFELGEEARGVWAWLWNRRRLEVLPEALKFIGRDDLAKLLEE